jgi:hypothetical protein
LDFSNISNFAYSTLNFTARAPGLQTIEFLGRLHVPFTVDAQTLFQTSHLPKDSQEFTRDWRRYHKSTAEQYKFLLEMGGDHLGQIFKTDINLLGDFLVALDSEYQDQDSETVTAILESLSSAQRFTLSVQFLSGKEKKSCESLICKLGTSSDDSAWKDRIEKLKSSYGLNK